MAIYHFTTRIIKSSIGKCAVASAAYISGQKLKDTRLGLSFNYTRKEEVVFAEVLLPKNAPEEKLYGMQLKKGKINETVSMQESLK